MLRFIPINITTAGDNVIFSGIPGKKIRVVAYSIIANQATLVQFKSGTTGITGQMSLSAAGGVATSSVFSNAAGRGMFACFEVDAGEDLVLNSSVATLIGGHATLYIID